MPLAPLLAVFMASPLATLALAVGAAEVPILIHLLNRKRYVVINWAAMRFLLAAQKKQVRRLKLEQWLLLATRVLVCLLILAAMASVRPWLEPLWQQLLPSKTLAARPTGRTHRIIVLDASFAMAAKKGEDSTRFELAKEHARAILEQAAPGDGFSLIVLSSPAQVIVAGPADDRDKVARELDALRLPHGSADVVGGLHAVTELVRKPLGKYAQREVYFLSDLRKSAWPLPLADATKPLTTPTGNASNATEYWPQILANSRVIAVDVAGRDLENLAVSSLTISEAVPLVNVDLAVMVVLQNHGTHAREQVPVELLVAKAGERLQFKPLGQKFIDLPANSAVNLSFKLDQQNRFREAGQYVLQVRLPEEPLHLDDVRSLTLNVRDTIPVMVVNGKPSPEPLERASGFLSRALNPFPDGQRSSESPAVVRVLNPREFQDAGLGDLFRPEAPTELVFLCDLPTLSGNEIARLEAHLKRGGSVVLGMGPNVAKNLEFYNRVLFNEGKGLLPGQLTEVKRANEGQYFSLHSDDEAFKVPPLSAFRSEEERTSFSTPRFDRFVRMDLPANSAARRLFSFVPSTKEAKQTRPEPAIVEFPRHRGRVIVFTSSFNTDWNEWPRTLSYAPFVQEVLRFAVSSNVRQTVLAGAALEEYVPANYIGLPATLTQEDGKNETLSVVAQDEAGYIRLPAAERAGVYRLCLPVPSRTRTTTTVKSSWRGARPAN